MSHSIVSHGAADDGCPTCVALARLQREHGLQTKTVEGCDVTEIPDDLPPDALLELWAAMSTPAPPANRATRRAARAEQRRSKRRR